MEERNLQLFPVNIFPFLGANEEELPLHFQEGLTAVSESSRLLDNNRTLTQPHNDSHCLILLFSAAGGTPEAKLIDANGCLPSKQSRIQICK